MIKINTLKKLLLVAGLVFLAYSVFYKPNITTEDSKKSFVHEQRITNSVGDVESAYSHKLSDVQVTGEGEVVKVLQDDNRGSRHQKFIIRMSSGNTLLVAHNIDLAERIHALQKGDTVKFNGEYVWNEKGGILHWTHHDPAGTHEAGWLEHNGNRYQ